MRKNCNLLGTAAAGAAAGMLMLAGSALAAPATGATPATPSQPMSAPQTSPTSSPYGASQSTGSSMSEGESLTQVSEPKTTLAKMPVQDSSGTPVGEVSSIKTSKHGKVEAVNVSLTGSGTSGKEVEIKASKLRYSPTSRTLKARLTGAEIRAMPKASNSTMQNP